MGTKNNPGKFDCYAAAEPDEPMFILLGRDPIAPQLVEAWADIRERERGPGAKVEEARSCAQAMREYVHPVAPSQSSPPSGDEGEGELDWSTFDGPTLNPGWTPDLQELIYTALNVLEHNGDEDDDAAEQIIERLLKALRSATTAERERDEARAEVEWLKDGLADILRWAEAYPQTVFTEPNFNAMREVLTAAGMPTALDAAHGTWGRHICEGIGKIARAALNKEQPS